MSKIKIAVNTRMLLPNRLDGIGYFANQTLKRITHEHPEIDFIFFFDRPYDKSFIYSDNIKPIVVFPQTKSPILYHVWFQYSIRWQLNKLKPNLFLSPDGLLSLSTNCRQLSIIHDINFAHNPKDLPFLYSLYFNKNFPMAARKASRIATVSEFSKTDISNTYKISPDKIDVVYNGVDSRFGPKNASDNSQTRSKYSGGNEYLLFVGSIHPRKNIGNILRAFEEFKTETKSTLKLLIVGQSSWGMGELKQILKSMKFRSAVVFTGRLSDDELMNVVAAAFCFVYPPYFEGFGVPLVEAMRSGVPVIASNTTSTPEIGGDAALYFDPFNISEIKKAIIKIANDNELRNNLIEKGFVQSNKFNWDKTSGLLYNSIQKTLHQ